MCVGLLIALFSAVSFVGTTLSANAQDAAPIVQEILVRYRGAKTVDESRILANMLTKVGDPLSTEVVEEDIKSLYLSGDVENVDIYAEDVAAGVRLIVEVQTRAQLSEVNFLGNSGISSDRLRRETELKVGQPVQDSKLQVAQGQLQELYRKKGFPDVGISYKVEDGPDSGFSRVTFMIDEGDKALLRSVRFQGNTHFTEAQLRKEMETGKFSFSKLIGRGRQADNDTLEQDVTKIQDFYRDNGYLNAAVSDVQRVKADDGKVDVVLTIAEGELYYVSSVNVSGNTVYTVEQLVPAIQLEVGQPFSMKKMRTDVKTISDYYGSRGYHDASVNPRIDTAAGNQLLITYDIRENDKSFIRKINIDGNVKTSDEVIRRELAVVPGEALNTVKLDASRRRLENLGYFQEPGGVEIFPVDSGVDDYKDINITLREKNTGTLNFGAGFSSIDNLVGFVDVTQTNFDLWNSPSFTGGGQKFRLGLKYGSKRRDFMLSLIEPWFMDQRLALGGEVFYRDINFLSDVYDQRQIGTAFSLRKPMGVNGSLKFEYKLQQVKIHNLDNDVSEAILSEEGEFLESQFAVDYNYDTRDSVFLPRRGHKFTASASGSGLGGDVKNWGLSAGLQKHWNLPYDSILSFEGNVNVVDSFGGDPVPIFNRQFLGGANNLRGFDFREVGPKDENGEPLGGGTSAYMTAELTVPIIEKVRGALFYDVGFVNNDSFDFSTGDVNSNFGVGLRLFLPVGPVRLDFGIPVQADEFNDSNGKFNFNIGYQF
ncbi:MAG: outer membrane protein assembly factor BamA [Verrucomicrobiales bacterium]